VKSQYHGKDPITSLIFNGAKQTSMFNILKFALFPGYDRIRYGQIIALAIKDKQLTPDMFTEDFLLRISAYSEPHQLYYSHFFVNGVEVFEDWIDLISRSTNFTRYTSYLEESITSKLFYNDLHAYKKMKPLQDLDDVIMGMSSVLSKEYMARFPSTSKLTKSMLLDRLAVSINSDLFRNSLNTVDLAKYLKRINVQPDARIIRSNDSGAFMTTVLDRGGCLLYINANVSTEVILKLFASNEKELVPGNLSKRDRITLFYSGFRSFYYDNMLELPESGIKHRNRWLKKHNLAGISFDFPHLRQRDVTTYQPFLLPNNIQSAELMANVIIHSFIHPDVSILIPEYLFKFVMGKEMVPEDLNEINPVLYEWGSSFRTSASSSREVSSIMDPLDGTVLFTTSTRAESLRKVMQKYFPRKNLILAREVFNDIIPKPWLSILKFDELKRAAWKPTDTISRLKEIFECSPPLQTRCGEVYKLLEENYPQETFVFANDGILELESERQYRGIKYKYNEGDEESSIPSVVYLRSPVDKETLYCNMLEKVLDNKMGPAHAYCFPHFQTVMKNFLKDIKFTLGRLMRVRTFFVERGTSKEHISSFCGWLNGISLRDMLFMIEYTGMPGVDAGGLTKDFLGLISDLFKTYYFGNTTGYVTFEKLVNEREMECFGRYLSMCLLHNYSPAINIHESVYRILFGRRFEFSDLQTFDEELYKTLLRTSQMSREELDYLDLDFVINRNGEDLHLVPYANITKVTVENVKVYVESYAKQVVYGDDLPVLFGIRIGFRQYIAVETFSKFEDFRGMQTFMSGRADLKRIRFVLDDDVVISERSLRNADWFCDIADDLLPLQLLRLFQFVTGLKAYNPTIQLKLKYIELSDEHLPRAETCFNRLVMPYYSSKEKMEKKIHQFLRIIRHQSSEEFHNA
jgi:hypothetical protein